MAKINRFSKVAPAKFNPLSVEEVMKVPLMKGAMEQEQLKAIEDKRLSVLNVEVAPGDVERVRAEQSRINQGLDDVIDNIQSNGVGFRSTDALNKVMSDINQTTSNAGLIGGASSFNTKRTAARKESRALAIKLGYNMDTFSQFEDAFDEEQSAFGADGKVTGGDYNALYLPNQLTPEEMLEAEVNKLGVLSGPSSSGAQVTSNKANLAAAKKLIIDRFATDPSYQRLFELSGLTQDQLIAKLDAKANVMLSSSVVAAKPVKPGSTTATDKAAAKAAEEARIEAEPLLTMGDSSINSLGVDITDAGMVKNEELRETNPNQYIKVRNLEKEVTRQFNEERGVSYLSELDTATTDLNKVSSADGELYTTSESAQQEIDANHTRGETATTSSNFGQIGTASFGGGATGMQVVPRGDGFIIAPIRDINVIDYTNKLNKYNSALNDFKAQDLNHAESKVFSVGESTTSGGESNKNEVHRYNTFVNEAIFDTNGYNIVSAFEQVTDGDDVGEPERVGLTKELDKKGFSVAEQDIKAKIANGKYEVVSRKQALPNEYYGPRIITKVRVTNADKTVSTYDLILEAKDSNDKKSAFTKAFNKGLDITDDTRAFREEFVQWEKFKGIRAEVGDTSEFLQTSAIYNRLKEGKVGSSLLNKNKDVGLVKNNGEYQLIRRDANGKTSPINVGEVVKAAGLNTSMDDAEITTFLNNLSVTNPFLTDIIIDFANEPVNLGISNTELISRLTELSENAFTSTNKAVLLDIFTR